MANQCSLPNYVVHSEYAFATELCCPQRICFRSQIVWPAANQFLLPNCGADNESVFTVGLWWLQRISSTADLCCLQRTNFAAEFYCPQWINFFCRILVSATNQCSLPSYVILNESAFAAKLCCPQRICFRWQIVWPATNQFSLSNCGACSESVSLPNCAASSEPVFAVDFLQ